MQKRDEIKRLFNAYKLNLFQDNRAMYLCRIALLNDAGYLDRKQRRELAVKLFQYGSEEAAWLKKFASDEYEYITSAHTVLQK
ncbi:hypothetical protein HZC00_05185 [Candidatus Kaiserbacteria bacterium]|nr:hypothetical protein [Candidatus Kaiserbacteria bacterium]